MAPRPVRCLVEMLCALASAGCFTPTNVAGVAAPDAGRPRDAGTCVRSCAGKQCGSDGCAGSCGTCPTGKTCNSAGQCEGPSKCQGVVCQTGETCDPADLVCKCTGAPGTQGSCPTYLICSATLHCVPICDQCCAKVCADPTRPTCKVVGTAAVCVCAPNSCGSGMTCGIDGACHDASVCMPPCAGEMPDCVATLCRCNATSCAAGKICAADGACHFPGSCTVETYYPGLSVDGSVQVDPVNGSMSFVGPVPSIDGTSDKLEIELYAGYGVFKSGDIQTGTFTLAGDDLDYATCGLCVLLFGNIDPAGEPAARYLATGGTVTISSIAGALTGRLDNVTFQHVDIDTNTWASTPDPDGCTSKFGGADFRGSVPVACDPLAPTACAAGEGCYYDGSIYSCATAGTVAIGSVCSPGLVCVPGADCFDTSSGSQACAKYCSSQTGAGCTAMQTCHDADGTVGFCAPCPTARICGSTCCLAAQFCDTVTMSCQARLPCDPITEQPCPGNQGCYFDWDSYRFECYTAGTLAGGAVCTQEYDCARGDGCGSNYACVPYCNVASPTNCAAPLSCTDYNGDGTVGYCE